jgi:DNA helicase HerA-like ATPase
MRLSNDRDQAYIRSATADATANILSFIPSLGAREVIAFGSGIALPSRMQFTELPPAMRPDCGSPGGLYGGTWRINPWKSGDNSHACEC